MTVGATGAEADGTATLRDEMAEAGELMAIDADRLDADGDYDVFGHGGSLVEESTDGVGQSSGLQQADGDVDHGGGD